jgi:holin family protein
MTYQQVFSEFAHDKQLYAVLILIVVDLVLGVGAAAYKNQFAFSKITGFLRDDVLGKVFPWFVLFAVAKFAPNADIVGIDFNQIQTAAWALVLVALTASLTASLADFGIAMPKVIATGENEGAPPTPSA